ncbi:serine protease hepsin-like isoform X2 [Schistocerca nitens]|uniref:serine protease hepsin-like isoform X2 n=1 Tax=Schistocerca nitens TaxID=7011 RepID=UPI0021178854|nr:serine protease hepsin-like isoform X2 [Schistocerca nitens]
MKTTPVLALAAALVLASDARRLEANARPRKLPFSAARKAPGGRIVGGSDAAEGQFPFQAGLMIDGAGFCGGSLISTTAVLTAAHCVDAGSYFTVLLGSTYSRPTSGDNSQSFAATDTVRHNGFYTPDDNAAFYDVGLVRWSQPITITDYVTPIRLPAKAQASESFAGWDAIVSGWGLTSNGRQRWPAQRAGVGRPAHSGRNRVVGHGQRLRVRRAGRLHARHRLPRLDRRKRRHHHLVSCPSRHQLQRSAVALILTMHLRLSMWQSHKREEM